MPSKVRRKKKLKGKYIFRRFIVILVFILIIFLIYEIIKLGYNAYEKQIKSKNQTQELQLPQENGLKGENNGVVSDKNIQESTAKFKKDNFNQLINKDNPIDKSYKPEETTIVSNNILAHSEVAKYYTEMKKAAQSDNINLLVISGYRSYDYQNTILQRSINSKIAAGMTSQKAKIEATKYITPPGTSEHQSGLALDIVTPSYTSLDAGFADTNAAKWLKENSWKYGFILRYPKDMESVTGILFEPWHFRYIGKELAKLYNDENIKNDDLTYEEFYKKYIVE